MLKVNFDETYIGKDKEYSRHETSMIKFRFKFFGSTSTYNNV